MFVVVETWKHLLYSIKKHYITNYLRQKLEFWVEFGPKWHQ